jgi:transposase
VRPEQRVPGDHPLRAIGSLVDCALEALSPRFEALYSHTGRPSIPPEKLLRALLLQAFYSVRSERQLMEQLEYNLLFRWFVGLSMDAPVWDATTFSKNRDRLLEGDIAREFMAAEPARGPAVAVEGALLGRRDADRGLGVDEELLGRKKSFGS